MHLTIERRFQLRSASLWATLFCSGMVQGCATSYEVACKENLWFSTGLEDGKQGIGPTSLVANYREACAKAGVEFDRQAYAEGNSIGLGRYCSFEVGFGMGLNYDPSATEIFVNSWLNTNYAYSLDYTGECPVDKEPAYLKGYLEAIEKRLDWLRSDRTAEVELRLSRGYSNEDAKTAGWLHNRQMRILQQVKDRWANRVRTP